MQFLDATNKTGLVEDIDFLVGTDSTSYPTAQKTRNINQWYLKAVSWILEADTRWQWDDSNYTDFPRGAATLVNGQKDYTLPIAATSENAQTFLKVIKVAVLNKSSPTQEIILIPSDDSEAVLNNAYPTSSLPRVYKLVSNSVKMWPAPDNNVSVTLASGLVVYFQRTPDLFTASDTTQQPGIPLPFHRILSLGGAFDYAIAKGLPQASSLRQEIEQLKQQMQGFFRDRNIDQKLRLSPRREKYN